MCGIVGYTGNKNATEILMKGLKSLEYRGYDSAGVAVFTGSKIKTVKEKGRLKNLKAMLLETSVEGNKIGRASCRERV